MSKRDLKILGNNFLKASFSKSNKRTAKILKLRGDLDGTKRLTLKEIGKRLGITRERVRQIERTWLNQHGRSFLFVFICDFIIEEGNLVTRLDSPRARLRKVLSRLMGIPFVELSDIGLLILGIRPKEAKFITQLFSDWKTNISTSTIAKSLEEQEKIFLTDLDIKTISICLVQAIYKHLNHSQKVYLALRSIGKPAYYSRVAEACNDLFPETQISERNIHAILCREEHNIIWIGVRGTYALKEWGYSRPSKTLFNTVTEIVNKFYRRTKKPVSYEMIIIEMSKYRKAYNPYSVLCATYRNPKLEAVGDNFFTPKRSSRIVQNKTSEEKLHRILENFQSKLNLGK